jgi:hypothetical protein
MIALGLRGGPAGRRRSRYHPRMPAFVPSSCSSGRSGCLLSVRTGILSGAGSRRRSGSRRPGGSRSRYRCRSGALGHRPRPRRRVEVARSSSIAVLGLLFGGPPIVVACIVCYAAFNRPRRSRTHGRQRARLEPALVCRVRLLTSLCPWALRSGRPPHNETGLIRPTSCGRSPARIIVASVVPDVPASADWQLLGPVPPQDAMSLARDVAMGRDAARDARRSGGADPSPWRFERASTACVLFGSASSTSGSGRFTSRAAAPSARRTAVRPGALGGLGDRNPGDGVIRARCAHWAALLVAGIILYALAAVSWAFLATPLIATRLLSGVAYAASSRR